MAFERKCNCLRDGWFVFDSTLVLDFELGLRNPRNTPFLTMLVNKSYWIYFLKGRIRRMHSLKRFRIDPEPDEFREKLKAGARFLHLIFHGNRINLISTDIQLCFH